MSNYIKYRDAIALAIATAQFPYNALGIIVEGKTVPKKDYWDQQTREFKEARCVEAQAVLSVMSGIGLELVMQEALNDYLSEK
jgi:hypothetical protein